MSQKHRHPMILGWLALVVLALVACSPSTRPTEPPAIQIPGLALMEDGSVVVDMMLTNLNPVSLNAKSARLRLASEGIQWVDWEQSVNWQVSANAREALSIKAELSSEEIVNQLNGVSQGQQASLSYSLTLALTLADDRRIEAEYRGFLYRVPGQSGRFR